MKAPVGTFMKQTCRATVRRSLLIIYVFLTAFTLHAQPGDNALRQIWQKGLPFITNYTTDDYKASIQNWSIIQDNQGVMYFANNSGILQFDGSLWRLIKTPGETTVRSFAKDSHGRIYVGGIGEVGYLEPDSRQGMTFHPLQQNLDSAYRDFGNVWFTYAIRDAIYFVCDDYIMRWENNSFHVTREPNRSFGFAWVIRDRLYVDVYGQGLMTMEGDALRMVSGGEGFSKKAVMGLLPFEKDHMIAFTIGRSILEYDGSQLVPFNKASESQLRDAVYQGIQLSTGDYALATTGSGFYTMDRSGNIQTNITRREGLSSDVIYAVYEDAEGDIWLATDNGISRLEINSPLRILNAHHGVDERPFDIEYFNGSIYITNNKGLFQLSEDQVPLSVPKLSFKKIKGIDNVTSACHRVGDELLISNYEGIFTLDKNNRITLVMPHNAGEMESPATSDQDHLIFDEPGMGMGIFEIFHESNGRWTLEKERLNISAAAYHFARSENGNLFIDTRRDGIYEVAWTDPNSKHRLSDAYTLIHHTPENGLASLNVKALGRIGNTVYVSTVNSVQFYDETKRTFQIDTLITRKIRKYEDAWVDEIASGVGETYWLSVYENFEGRIFKGQHGSLEELEVSGRFSDALATKIYDTKQGVVLFGSNKSIVLYDEHHPVAHKNTFRALIRKVAVNQDSVIYAGHGAEDAATEIEIPYSDHDLRFQFSLPSYDLSTHTQYQYYLEGFAEDWSSWSTEAMVDFTNLAEGNYVFHVRGRNIYGHVSEEDRFTFAILPPWYRTWWAYTLYAILLGSVISLVASQRARKLKQEKIELENIIQERTQTILQQTEELKAMDRLKSRFFANISHEFRTPLTLILSPLEEEIAKRASDRESLMLIQRNANRLLELVNQLLDLSKLEAGKMQLQLRPGDLPAFLRVISASFDSLAEHKQIEFVKTFEVPAGIYKYDADKVEKIVTNLLGNAFKFTPRQGKVVFAARCREQSQTQVLAIQVSDTGMGIAPEEQEHIFESFYQANEGHEGGTGLGLSLVKELVKLYRGTISLNSALGKGATFLVEIPLDGELLSDHPSAFDPIVAMPERAPIGADPAEEEQIDQSHPERDTVLVVEDNADLRNYISAFLEREFSVVAAPNGKEALDIARKIMPDLVLSDLMMPLMNGLQLTEKIKTDNVISHIPVILLTARNEHESKMEGLKIGADDYLTKPFSNEELLVRVRNLITQRKNLAERYRERILVPATITAATSLDDKFLYRAKEVVEENLSDVLFTVEKMADEMALSRTQLLRKLKALTGLSPNEFIKDLRLKRAADMIRQKADTITQIGYAVGFNDQSYFTKCFKKQFAVTPTEYAQQVAS